MADFQCPYCKRIVETIRAKQKTCFSKKCQDEHHYQSIKDYAVRNSKGISPGRPKGSKNKKSRMTKILDTKCPRCGKIRKTEVINPLTMRMRRDYCENCIETVAEIDNSVAFAW